MSVWFKRVAWGAGGVVALVLLLWLGVPALIQWQAPPRLSALLGRPVTIGRVGFQPWKLALRVDDFAIGGRTPADAPLLKIRHTLVNVSTASLFRLAPVIEALEVDGPELRVARTAEGHYDIDDLIERFTPKEPAPPPGEPAHFALYNVQLRDGLLAFDDRPVKRVQRIEALNLALPFISDLPKQVDIKVEPHLAFKLNGTPFDSGAQATPFAKTRAGVLKIAMTDLDLAPYLGYLPASLPVRVLRGSVSADLGLTFAMPPDGTPSVALQGRVGAKNLALADASGAPLLEWQALQLGLRDVQPLARKLGFDALRVEGLQLHARRDAAGRINLLELAGSGAKEAPTPVGPAASAVASASASATASAAASSAPAVAAATPAGGWQVALDVLTLAGARVDWNDATVRPAAALVVDGLDVEAKQVRWPIAQPIALAVKGALHPAGAASAGAASFTFDGPLTDHGATLKIAVKSLPLSTLAPYAAQSLTPELQGMLSAQAELGWAAAPDAPRLTLALAEATLDGFALREAGGASPREGRDAQHAQDAVTLKQLALADAKIDILARSAMLGSVKLVQPNVVVARAADGSLNFDHWTVGSGASPARADKPPESATARAPAAKPVAADAAWRVQLKDLLVDDGTAKFSDASVGGASKSPPAAGSSKAKVADAAKPPVPAGPPKTPTGTGTANANAPVRIEVGALHLAVQGFEWHGDQEVAPAQVQLAARVGSPAASNRGAPRDGARRTAGTLDFKGRVGLTPLVASGTLNATRLPVQPFAPYFADLVPLQLLAAELGYRGDVGLHRLPAGLDVSAAGDALIGGLHVATLPVRGSTAPPDELLSWQSLKLTGMKFAMKPRGKPQVAIADAALTDLYARLVVTEQGRFNLQDVTGAPVDAATADAPANGASAPASAASGALENAAAAASPSGSAALVTATATAGEAATTAAVPALPGGAARAAAPADAIPLPIDIRVGGIRLINGRIDYSDHFVRPNYSAALTELNGQLGAFSSARRDPATLSLHGRAEGTALLDISGSVNPTARPLALDIQAKATDLELAPLSPYAAKYAGYAIERGKLSMDVAYRIDPDGKLEARNQVVLNQLTFGDKVESKDATKLPVLLAVALLKDRNGVIDINLPISGSLNDPKFSVGGLIVKVIVNLLVKALTSPFALLGGGGGGSDDLSVVEFQPGTAQFTTAGAAAVDKVAKALTERPALKMTVTGASDPVSERAPLQHAEVEARLVAAARRDQLRASGTAPDAAASAAAASAPASAASGPAAAAAAPAPTITLPDAERTRLLTRLYKDTDIPDKPRNALGFAKDLAPAEMEALLAPRMPANDDVMRDLALQRGLAVRDALIAKGLPSERLFLAAPALRAAADDKDNKATWTPRVQLSLTTH